MFCAQKNHLMETVLLSTGNLCFGSETRKLIFWYTLLTKGLWYQRDLYLISLIIIIYLSLDDLKYFLSCKFSLKLEEEEKDA